LEREIDMVRAIDMHVHPYTIEFFASMGEPMKRAAVYFGRSKASHQHEKLKGVELIEESAIPIEETIRYLKEECGLEMAVMMNMNGVSRWGGAVANEILVHWASKEPDFLRVFCSVDPHLGETAVRELRHCIEDLGCVGLKLHPSYQEFYPNDRKIAYPLYEVCEGLGVPVIPHTGTTRLYGTPMKYGQPIYWDDVAIDFPKLKIILTHWAIPWVEEAIHVVWRNENVYMDVSGVLPRYYPPQVWHYTQMKDFRGKIIFGSDYPFITSKAWIEAFNDFNEWFCPLCNRKEGWKDPRIKEEILRDNFIKLMGKERLGIK